MQIFSPRSILVSMIMFVLISLSRRHVSTFLLSRAVTEKNMLIKDTTKELFILTFFFPRKPICWFQPPSGEGIVSAEAPRRCGGFLTPLIASWWFRSWAIVPWLQWRHQFEPALEIPATPPQSLAHPNPVAQMPSLNRRLVWWRLPSACLRKPPGHTN